MNSSGDTSTLSSFFSQPAVLGIIRGLAGFPIEHPLEVAKVSAQAQPLSTSKEVISRIYYQRGVLGFANTFLPNFPRKVIRESARWMIIDFSHRILTDSFPSSFAKNEISIKILTGTSLAFFDSCFLLPFEQLIAYRIKENEPYRTFYQNRIKKEGIGTLYRGFQANLMRQGVAWSIFLPMNYQLKKTLQACDNQNEHPYLRQAAASVIIGTTLAVVGLPTDFVKVRLQMDNDLQNIRFTEAIKRLFQKYRVKGFYSGFAPALICTIFQSTIKGVIADALLNRA